MMWAPRYSNVFQWKTITYDKTADTFYLDKTIQTTEIECSVPLSVGWIITGKCNLNCIHCYWNEEELPLNEVSPDEAMIIASKIVSEGIKRVSISWGEPMLRRDLPIIVDYLSDHWVWVIVSTNGLNISDKLPQLKKLRHIELSLDGATETIHDYIRPSRIKGQSVSFKNAISGIRAALDMGIKTRVLTSLNIFNYKNIQQIWALLSSLGVHEWHIGKTTNAGRARFIYGWLMDGVIFSEFDLDELRNKFPGIKIQYNYPSKANKYYGLIMPDWQMATQDYKTWEKISLGSLVEKSFGDFWIEDNFDTRGHYYKWLNLNPDTFLI